MEVADLIEIGEVLQQKNYKSNELFQQCLIIGLSIKDSCIVVRKSFPNIENVIKDVEEKFIRMYVKTFEDICHILNINIDKFNKKYINLNKDYLAEIKLKLIIKVLNNDWIPKLDGKEYMYTPYFKYDGINNSVGDRQGSFSYDRYNGWLTSSYVGFGWGFKNKELMIHCVNNFLDLWNDYLSYGTNQYISDDILNENN